MYDLKNNLTLTEFKNWSAFFELENEQYNQTDVNIARIAVLINNYICKTKIKIKDVLPINSKKKMSDEEGCLSLRTLFNALKRKK